MFDKHKKKKIIEEEKAPYSETMEALASMDIPPEYNKAPRKVRKNKRLSSLRLYRGMIMPIFIVSLVYVFTLIYTELLNPPIHAVIHNVKEHRSFFYGFGAVWRESCRSLAVRTGAIEWGFIIVLIITSVLLYKVIRGIENEKGDYE